MVLIFVMPVVADIISNGQLVEAKGEVLRAR